MKYGEQAIAETASHPLECWPNPAPDRDYLIHIEHPEYSALCPRSGYPDSGTIVIDYVPDGVVVELKAIKLYINSFRNRSISHESATNEMADRFWRDIQPRALRLIGDFMRRGGVKTVITIVKQDSPLFQPYHPTIL